MRLFFWWRKDSNRWDSWCQKEKRIDEYFHDLYLWANKEGEHPGKLPERLPEGGKLR